MAKKPSPKRPVGSRSARESDDYEVGYGRPPKHGQFPPGKSGNPKGRPSRHRNFRSVLETVLNETVRMREGEKVRLVPKSEALVRTVIQGALQRDPKAVASLMTLMRVTGVGIKETAEQQDDAWTPTEQQVLDYLHRKGAQSKG